MKHELDISPLGMRLVDKGLLDDTQLSYVLQKQAVEGGRLGVLLVRHGLVSEAHVARVLAEQAGIPFVDVGRMSPPGAAVLRDFNREMCLSRNFLPLNREGDRLDVLLGDALPEDIEELVRRRVNLTPRFVQGEFSRVIQLIRQSYFFADNPVEDLLDREIRTLNEDLDHAHSPDKLLELLLHLAVRDRATDVHLTPGESSLHVFFRVDGVLAPLRALPAMLSRLVMYIKLVAEMDISEQRRPQDGSFHCTILDLPFTVRVSTLVSEYGERVVLRLLPENLELGGLEMLGYLKEDIATLERVFSKPSGMVLVTGPTGSGKSTTLHGALRMQSLLTRNVLTVEDPVEYRVPGACQTEVNRRAGYDFSSALRHFLRHDPDVMLIGEIRDAETARAVVEAAATGHLVLTTLHVTSAFSVFSRLRPFGLDGQSIADNLIAVVNQRLVRENCPHCRREHAFAQEERAWLGISEQDERAGIRGEGCEHCHHTGFLGRLPVYEILEISQSLADAVANGGGRDAIRRVALEEGFVDMLELARARVLRGETTLDEIRRVLGVGPHRESNRPVGYDPAGLS